MTLKDRASSSVSPPSDSGAAGAAFRFNGENQQETMELARVNAALLVEETAYIARLERKMYTAEIVREATERCTMAGEEDRQKTLQRAQGVVDELTVAETALKERVHVADNMLQKQHRAKKAALLAQRTAERENTWLWHVVRDHETTIMRKQRVCDELTIAEMLLNKRLQAKENMLHKQHEATGAALLSKRIADRENATLGKLLRDLHAEISVKDAEHRSSALRWEREALGRSYDQSTSSAPAPAAPATRVSFAPLPPGNGSSIPSGWPHPPTATTATTSSTKSMAPAAVITPRTPVQFSAATASFSVSAPAAPAPSAFAVDTNVAILGMLKRKTAAKNGRGPRRGPPPNPCNVGASANTATTARATSTSGKTFIPTRAGSDHAAAAFAAFYASGSSANAAPVAASLAGRAVNGGKTTEHNERGEATSGRSRRRIGG